uniref:ankyrin repeat domain-containing protein 53 n=1 Tax=Semicossyphus pulcher TaxID=241346 RepID=UPI0037E6FF73
MRAAPDGLMFPAVAVGSSEKLDGSVNRQGLSELHMACLYGQLATVQLLLDSRPERINSSDQQGRRPVHMLLSSRSSPKASSCLRYLLEHGADVSVTTDSGATPLHLAASAGLLECTEILVQAGADVSARDSMGLTPLDFARICCHREVARYLKSCMWQEDKRKEMQERKQAQALYTNLVEMVRLNDCNKKTMVNRKGFPLLKDFTRRAQVSKYHTKCLSSDLKPTKHPQKNQEDGTSKPPASSSRPWTIFLGHQPEKPPVGEPDLRGSVTLWKDISRPPQYSTKWDSTPRPAPDLPLDVLERVLFPREFPSRIASPRDFEPQDIVEVQHRGYPQGRSTSPWTEVAMHLVEVLEFGHY